MTLEERKKAAPNAYSLEDQTGAISMKALVYRGPNMRAWDTAAGQ